MIIKHFVNNKKIAVLFGMLPSIAIFISGLIFALIWLLGLLYSQNLKGEEQGNLIMDINCQNAQGMINLQITNQSEIKHLIKLTSANQSQFTTSINKYSQANLKFSKEQLPLKINSSYLDKTEYFVIDKNCKITS